MNCKHIAPLPLSLLAFGMASADTTYSNAQTVDANGSGNLGAITVTSGGDLTLYANTGNLTIGDGLYNKQNNVESGGKVTTKADANYWVQLNRTWNTKNGSTIDLQGNTRASGGIINAGNFSLAAGKTLTFLNGNFTNNAGGQTTLNGTFINTNQGSITVNGGSISLNGAGNQLLGGTINVSNGGTFSAGTGADITAAGLKVTGGQATFNDKVTISGSSNGSFSVTAGQVTFNGSTNSIGATATISGGEVTFGGANNTFGNTVTMSGGTASISGSTNSLNSSLTLSGGELTLGGESNSINGPVNISGQGHLTLAGAQSNSIASSVSVGDTAIFEALGETTLGQGLDNKGIASITKKITVNGKTTNSGVLTLDGNASDSTFSAGFENQTNGTAKLDANITITSTGLTVSGGDVTLGGTANSITAGGVKVSGGQLTLASGSKTTLGTGDVTLENGILDLTQGGTLELGTSGKYEQKGGTLNANLDISGGKGTINEIAGGTTTDGASITGGKLNFTTKSNNPAGTDITLQTKGGAKLTSASGLTAADVTINGRQAGYITNIATYSLTGLNTQNGLVLSINPDSKPFCNFEGGNCSLANVLNDMNNNFDSLPEDYKAFFNALVNTRAGDYREALRAMDNKTYLDAEELLLTIQSSEILDKIRNLQEGIEGVYIKPRYTRFQNKAFNNTHRTGFEIYANKNTSYGRASVFANYDHLTGHDLRSHMFNVGAAARTNGTKYPIDFFTGIRVGGANTEVKNTSFGNYYNQGKYKFHTTHAAVFAGIDKDIAFEATHILPTMYLAYFYQGNSRFKTEGMDFDHLINHTDTTGGRTDLNYSGKKLFSRKIKGLQPHYLTLNLGASVQQNFGKNYRWSAHAFYERRINRDTIKSKSTFVDWPSSGHWYQELDIGKNLIRAGGDLLYQPAPVGFFALVGLDYATAVGASNGYREYGADLKLGVKF